MTRLASILCSGLLALASLLSPVAAHAHAALTAVTPSEGALLDDAPAEVVMTFNETVRPLAIMLIGPDGDSRDLTSAASGDSTLTIALPDLARGTQVLSWRVTSDDGHPVTGTLVFSVGDVSGAAEVAVGDPLVAGFLWGAKLLMSVGLLLGIGGALFGALARLPPGTSPPLSHLIWLGLVMTPLALGLHGADALGLPLAGLFTAEAWGTGWATSFGTMTVLAVMAGLLGLAGLSIRPLAFVAVALLAAAYASAGHAGAADPRWLSRSMVFAHLAALTFWLGALIPLLRWLRRADGAAALQRFSDLIPVAVILLAASGFALGLLQMGDAGFGGWSTAYGRILVAKLVLLAMLFLLAAWNRWSLTTPALQAEPKAILRLRMVIIIELILVTGILGLAAGWRFTPPPRALAMVAAAPPAYAHIMTADLMADLTITPGNTGTVATAIWLSDSAMQPVSPQAVTLSLAMPTRGIERMSREARVDTEGVWHVPDLILPLAGDWQIDLEIRMTRFSISRIEGTVTIQ